MKKIFLFFFILLTQYLFADELLIYDVFKYTINENDEIIITGSIGNSSSLDIPDVIDGKTVTTIGDKAFLGCSSLSTITIPNSVINIGDYAFHGCTSLCCIVLPDSITSISAGAFLSSIIIPNSVTSIGSAAFYFCESLISIKIPNSVKKIGYFAFPFSESLIIQCNSGSFADIYLTLNGYSTVNSPADFGMWYTINWIFYMSKFSKLLIGKAIKYFNNNTKVLTK